MTLTLRRRRRSTPMSKVAPLAADAREAALRYAESTKGWAAPRAAAAKDVAKDKMEPALEKVTHDIVPAVAAAVTGALAASEPVRHEAATRGSAALAALKGEVAPPKRKKHRLRKLFLLASVLGAAYAGWKAFVAQQQSADSHPVDAWRTPSGASPAYAASTATTPAGASNGSPGVTAPSAAPVAPVDRPTTDDPAGAGPDEALADAADEAEGDKTGSTSTRTTETVSATQAKKTSEAAAKGAGKSAKGSSKS